MMLWRDLPLGILNPDISLSAGCVDALVRLLQNDSESHSIGMLFLYLCSPTSNSYVANDNSDGAASHDP